MSPPALLHTKAELAAARPALPAPVVLVPTMGALHAGHLALLQAASAAAGPASVRAARSKARCPACSAPMVGTRTTGPAHGSGPPRAAASSALVRSRTGHGPADWLMGGRPARQGGARRRPA